MHAVASGYYANMPKCVAPTRVRALGYKGQWTVLREHMWHERTQPND